MARARGLVRCSHHRVRARQTIAIEAVHRGAVDIDEEAQQHKHAEGNSHIHDLAPRAAGARRVGRPSDREQREHRKEEQGTEPRQECVAHCAERPAHDRRFGRTGVACGTGRPARRVRTLPAKTAERSANECDERDDEREEAAGLGACVPGRFVVRRRCRLFLGVALLESRAADRRARWFRDPCLFAAFGAREAQPACDGAGVAVVVEPDVVQRGADHRHRDQRRRGQDGEEHQPPRGGLTAHRMPERERQRQCGETGRHDPGPSHRRRWPTDLETREYSPPVKEPPEYVPTNEHPEDQEREVEHEPAEEPRRGPQTGLSVGQQVARVVAEVILFR